MKSSIIAATLLLAHMGCTSQSGSIAPGNIDGPLQRVAARHDKYVTDDTSLTDLQKRVYLRDTSLLNGVLNASKAATTQPAK